MLLTRDGIGDQRQQVFGQGDGLGGALQPAGDRDDAEGCGTLTVMRVDLKRRTPMLGLAFNEVKWCYFNNP